LVSTDHLNTVVGNMRGVLGEEFLQNFDALIDYRHPDVRLESESSSMAETAMGEQLSLELNGTYLSLRGSFLDHACNSSQEAVLNFGRRQSYSLVW
jgi:hypothetical protein